MTAMRLLTPIDRVVVVTLFAVWAVLFGLSIQAQVQDIGIAPLLIEKPGPDGRLVFIGMRPPVTVGDSGLVPGDVLLRLGDRDLAGASRMDVLAWVPDQAHGVKELPIVYERDGVRHEAMLPLEDHRAFWPILPTSAAGALVALLLALRMRPTRFSRLLFLAMMTGAIELATFCMTSEWVVRVVHPLRMVAAAVSIPLLLMVAQRFPDGRPPESAIARWFPWVFVLRGLVVWSFVLGGPIPPRMASLVIGLTGLAFLLAAPLIVWNKYRRADAIARRQMRWVLFGVLVAMIPPSVAFPMAIYDPSNFPLAFASICGLAILPFCLLVAIGRYNLFDVDRLLSSTASYNLLILVLLGGLLLVVPTLAHAASGVIGTDPSTTQAVFSIVLVGVVLPAQRPLKAGIERLFFRERVQTDEAFADLARSLAGSPDAGDLLTRLGEGLETVLRPSALAIYAPDGDALTPVVAYGSALPAAIERDGPLFGTLASGTGPIALGLSGGGRRGPALGPFERAALEALGAEAVLPLVREHQLVAVLCLGEKRSGDVYTTTDMSWLRTLGDRVTAEFDRFDHQRVIAESHAMQAELRRYVPGAVAEEIEKGRGLDAREREVSVLFVDIRGYTSFSEGRAAAEIFGTVNAYTETVSRIVREHGGAVVEFNGDGMMAVFGAPRELPAKEDAAVRAGLVMLTAIPDVPREGALGGLRVGVGVATGPAFVGNIRAADRFIWTAIGNTINLASRLQSLTRDLDVGMLVDGATHDRLSSRAGFHRTEPTPIRGRSEPMTLYSVDA
jgi:class 3 adenylate cyclase